MLKSSLYLSLAGHCTSILSTNNITISTAPGINTTKGAFSHILTPVGGFGKIFLKPQFVYFVAGFTGTFGKTFHLGLLLEHLQKDVA